MEKRRINTTISTKHWELLKKHANHFETQQKALEHAIQLLENSNSSELTPYQRVWVHFCEIQSVCVSRDMFKAFLKNSNVDMVLRETPQTLVHVIEDQYQKPLKKCTLKEILDGLLFIGRAINWFESVSYTDEREYYYLKFVHSLSLNCSKLNNGLLEELFREYGTKIESDISEYTIFVRIYKNAPNNNLSK